MNKALLISTLILSRWAIVTWAIGLALTGMLIIMLFDSMEMGEAYKDLLQTLPEGFKNTIGLTDEILATYYTGNNIPIAGLLSTEYLTWWPIMVGIYAFFFGAGVVAKEADKGTMEILMSQPIPRYWVITSKFSSFSVLIGILMLATIAGIYLGILISGKELDIWRLTLTMIQGGITTLSIAAYSVLISSIFLNSTKATAISGAITAIMYLMHLFGPYITHFTWIQKISVFHYYQPIEIMLNGNFNVTNLFLNGLVMLGILYIAVTVIQRRNNIV